MALPLYRQRPSLLRTPTVPVYQPPAIATPAIVQTTRPLNVLIACERTGMVRRAFAALNHNAWSCDLRPAEDGSNQHLVGDVRQYLGGYDGMRWDLLMVAHPPCTRLCNSGVLHLRPHKPPQNIYTDNHTAAEVAAYRTMNTAERHAFMMRKLDEGCALFSDLWNADETHGIPRLAVENPVMHYHAKERIRNFREHSQTFQPWQFGDLETKRTCLWLKGLPALVPPIKVKPAGVKTRVHGMSRSATRGLERSEFFPGVAAAMAAQWGNA